jgi:GTPase
MNKDVMAQAADSLRQLLDDPDIPASVRSAMQPEFVELSRALAKLENDELHVAVFGRVSVGKSAVLNALLQREAFAVGVLHGTTVQADQHTWREGLHQAHGAGVHVIDTPGIDELGGEAREQLAHAAAARVDLILFVIDGDITDTELSALRQLVSPTRPMLLILNKVDRYTQDEVAALIGKLRARVAGLLPPENVLAATARPRERIVIRISPSGEEVESTEARAPDLAAVKKRIGEILDAEGKTIAALNAGLMAGAMSDQLAVRLIAARAEVANKLIHTYSLSKALAVGINPIPVADLVAAAGLDVALIVHLSRIYGLPMTKVEAGELIGTICAQLALLMGAIWGVHIVASALKGLSVGLSTVLTGTAQGALAYYATTLTGKAAQKYLQNGKSWGELGPKRVVQNILASLDRDSMLKTARAEILARLQH